MVLYYYNHRRKSSQKNEIRAISLPFEEMLLLIKKELRFASEFFIGH